MIRLPYTASNLFPSALQGRHTMLTVLPTLVRRPTLMGDTYNRMAILVSDTQKLFLLWDRSQLIFILSRTRILKNTILLVQIMKQFAG